MTNTQNKLEEAAKLAEALAEKIRELNSAAAQENTLSGNLISNIALEEMQKASQIKSRLQQTLNCFLTEE